MSDVSFDSAGSSAEPNGPYACSECVGGLAVDSCERCGALLCGSCGEDWDPRIFCLECAGAYLEYEQERWDDYYSGCL